jgi:hypothetical protein
MRGKKTNFFDQNIEIASRKPLSVKAAAALAVFASRYIVLKVFIA